MKCSLLVLIFSFSNLSFAKDTMQQNDGFGFAFELLLAKLESIESRLIGLEEKLENVSSRKADTDITRFIQTDNEPKLVPAVRLSVTQSSSIQTTEDSEEVLRYESDEISNRNSEEAQPNHVLCDSDPSDSGWVVVQRRFNGSESFNRKWEDYEKGFGSQSGEFWLGLKKISSLVNNGRQWEILLCVKHVGEPTVAVRHGAFMIGNANDGYKLKQIGNSFRRVTADPFKFVVGTKFSTSDRDNDLAASTNCAFVNGGGWWYNWDCNVSNPNGMFVSGYNRRTIYDRYMTKKVMKSKIMIRERTY